MARSKRTQRQIQDKKANEYDYIGDKQVAENLHEIEFQPSSLETIDGAMLRFIDEELNLLPRQTMVLRKFLFYGSRLNEPFK